MCVYIDVQLVCVAFMCVIVRRRNAAEVRKHVTIAIAIAIQLQLVQSVKTLIAID